MALAAATLWLKEALRPAVARAVALGPHAFPAAQLLPLAEGVDVVTRALLLHRAGKHDDAVKLLADQSGPRAQFVRLCALDLDSKADFEPAMKFIQQALAVGPKFGENQHTLGLLHYRAGRYEEAAKVFQSALKDAPGWPPALNQLGLALAYHRLGKTDEARKWWGEAKRWLDENPRPAPTPWQSTLPWHPHDWLGGLLLRREAERYFGGAEPGGKPAVPPPAPKD